MCIALRLWSLAGLLVLFGTNLLAPASAQSLNVNLLGQYDTGQFDESAAEIVAYDPGTQRLYFVNAFAATVDVLDISKPSTPTLINTIDVTPYGAVANSVAIKNGIVAVAVEAEIKQSPGSIVFFDTDGTVLNQVQAGALPDMVTFTPDGTKVLVANEGEPSDDYTNDPEGSVTLIDISGGVANATAQQIRFSDFNTDGFRASELPADVRIFGPNASVAEDLEPEYIAISDDGTKAYVTFQENNAVGIIDIASANVDAIVALGFKDHSLPGNTLDASNRDSGIRIRNWPVFGMYQPDAIASYTVDGQSYFITANEGDARDYDGFSEEVRGDDLTLDRATFLNPEALQQSANLGRLKTTTASGDTDGDGDHDIFYSYGARSFTIWNGTTGALVYDSGDDFERITSQQAPAIFNSQGTRDSFDSRSDDKGSEPEAVVVGEIAGKQYAFIGLERIGGFFVYDISDPNAPVYDQYEPAAKGDIAPEGMVFIAASDSPTGKDLVVLSNEVSGTVSIYGVEEVGTPEFQLQVLHTADQEAGLPAIEDAVHFSAVLNRLAQDYPANTLRLSSGDIYIPGPFFNTSGDVLGGAGNGDILINNALGFQAVALGNHEFDLGTDDLGRLIRADANTSLSGIPGIDTYPGTAFPYLSTNLDVITDANLAGLAVASGQAPQPNSISKSVVIEVAGERVGVIGATTPTLAAISSPGDVTILPADATDRAALAAVIQAEVDALTATGINKVVLLTHMQQIAIEQELATLLTDVDIIMAGGSNTLLATFKDPLRTGDEAADIYPLRFNSPTGEPTYVINTDGNYTYVGRLVADFDANGLITSIGDESGAYATDAEGVDRVYGSDVNPADVADPVVVAVTEAISGNVLARDGTLTGRTSVFLNGTRGDVRTQETNLGNLTADANLWQARQIDPTVQVSIKNGGGIRADIGQVLVPAGGVAFERFPPAANPLVGKEAGQISQLDIENTLRFNNSLTVLTATAEELLALIEHGVAATEAGATPGRFPQVGGMRFSFDPSAPAGDRVQTLVIVNEAGGLVDVVVQDGALVGNPTRPIRLVTLGFLAGGGDGYPFPNREVLALNDDGVITDAGTATFSDPGREQDALAEYLIARYADTPFMMEDVPPAQDTRIQDLSQRDDMVVPTFTLQVLHAADQEAGLPAIEDAVHFSAVLNRLAQDYPANTLRLSSGDIYIPGPFFNTSGDVLGGAGNGDILINNALGFQAVALGNHEFDLGTDDLGRLIRADANTSLSGIPGIDTYPGTAFPYLSTNLDVITDANLAGLAVASGQAPQPNSISKSVVIEVAGERVGVIGATTPTLAAISSPGDVTILPADATDRAALAAVIQAEVDALTATGINKVVLLTHMQQIAIEQELATLLTDVDIIMAGGSNTLLANDDDPLRTGDTAGGVYPLAFSSASGEPTYVINTDGNYTYVGRLVADFDANGLITAIGDESGAYATDAEGVDRVYGSDVNPTDVADPIVVAVTEAISGNVLARDGTLTGRTDVFLNGTRGDVRTQETNLGNLTADANLWQARQIDPTVQVSIKNGGGIRADIGQVLVPAGGVAFERFPPAANPLVGKEEGQISQLDIENTLRFNNSLTLLTATAEELLALIEHGVSATEPGATPGRFPQVGGMRFSFDPAAPANDRVQNLVVVDNEGLILDIIAKDGEIMGNPAREIRLVTLGFLAGGGDGYPFPDRDVIALNDDGVITDAGTATFSDAGREQDALAEYLITRYADNPFMMEDVPPAQDQRIQDLSQRSDMVVPTFTLQVLHAADQEAGLPAIEDAVHFSAVLNRLAQDYPANTLRLSSGDIYIPGPFFNTSNDVLGGAGNGDILINNALGFQAVALGNHEFDLGTDDLGRLIRADANTSLSGIPGIDTYPGTAFPYLSTNLDVITDANLAGLAVASGQAPQPNSISKSVVIEVAGERVGIVGATTPTLAAISSPGDVTILPADATDHAALTAVIQAEVDALTATGINKVVLLTHMQQIAIEQELATLLTDVDIIMAGGSNTLLANDDDPLRAGDTAGGVYPLAFSSASGEPTYVINTDGNYTYVGRLVADFDANGLITSIGDESGAYATDAEGVDRVYGSDVNPADVADPVVVAVTEAISGNVLARDGTLTGRTAVFLNGTRGDVRIQETNLGNLTADANLWQARQIDPTVAVSIKNGGGIRADIGQVLVPAGGVAFERFPPAANPLVGKEAGQISQLDIENTLRFNNSLTLLTATAEELLALIEHGVAATEPGATPGRFPQVGGMRFSFDPAAPANDRVQTLAIVNRDGFIVDTIAEDGALVGNPTREIRLVTLGFLAGGGDGYPFPNREVLALNDDGVIMDEGASTFSDAGREQDALAEYLITRYADNPFMMEDVPPAEDTRIVNLSERDDPIGTSVDATAELPQTLTLDQNYPNPFNPVTTIRYGLPQAQHVTLVVYDMLGRAVATVVNGQQQTAGWHTVSFDARDLASGTYLYRLQAGAASQMGKMVLLK